LEKLSKTDANKEVIREDGGVGALVSSLNFYRDNSSVTSLMVRAMNYLFAKETEGKASPDGGHPAASAATVNDSDEDVRLDLFDNREVEVMIGWVQSKSSGSDTDSDGEKGNASPRDDISSKLDEIERLTGDMLMEVRNFIFVVVK